MLLQNSKVIHKTNSWLTILTNDGYTLEVNTQTKTISKLNLKKLLELDKKI